MARHWQAQGARRLHVVDLDAARSGGRDNAAQIRRLLAAVDIPVQVGGGVRSLETARALLGDGADRVVVGSALAEQPTRAAEWVVALGSARLVVAVDARSGRVAVHGWLDTTELDTVSFARHLAEAGVRRVLYTDIGRDGMLSGPDLEGTRLLVDQGGLHVLGSGGVASVAHLRGAGQRRRRGRDRRHRALRRSTGAGRRARRRLLGGRGMLTRRVIPCLDVDRGRVIRGVRFSADRVVGDAVELAAEYNRQGADELVFYDITASAEERGLMLDVLRAGRGAGLHPADRRRWRAHRRRRRDPPARRRRQGQRQHAGGAQPGADRRGGRPLRLAVHRAVDRRALERRAGLLRGGHPRRAPADGHGGPGLGRARGRARRWRDRRQQHRRRRNARRVRADAHRHDRRPACRCRSSPAAAQARSSTCARC